MTKIINDYQTSPYFYEHVDNFLGVRTRELDTIANVLAKAEEGSSITIDFGDTGEGFFFCLISENINAFCKLNQNEVAKLMVQSFDEKKNVCFF